MKNLLSLALFLGILFTGFAFTACDETETEDLTTVQLEVFGPSPALRGGELRFIGKNMDRVTAIILPDNIEVKTFVSKTKGELVIAIPQDAMPGKIVVKSPDGDIQSKTPLTFLEPISIEGFAPATVKAGDKLTIDGDYLNLIAEVIFDGDVVVDSTDFVSKSRKKIEVIVPIEARTGKFVVSNGAEMPALVYSATELQVKLPVIGSMNPNPVKPGASLQIGGTDLDLVKSIRFAEGIDVGAFTINTAKTQIDVTVPDDVKEGKLKLIAHSGVEVESSTLLSLVGPAVSSIAPSPVKNGEDLTITGTNLDLVTGIKFAGNADGAVLSKTATQLVVTVPLTATEGVVTLTASSGKTAGTPAITLVKPVITGFAPASLMAGGDITISGTDLDLIRKVSFPGNLSVDVVPTSPTSLTVTVPPASVGSAVLIVTTTNGSTVSSAATLTVEAANKPVATAVAPATLKPGAMLTIQGTKLHLVESVYFGTIKATSFGTRSATTIEVQVPAAVASGKQAAKMVAFDGAEVMTPEFTVSGTDPVTAQTKMVMDFETRSSSDWHAPDWDNWGGSYDAAKAKADGYITLLSRPGWWVVGCNHPDPNGGWPVVDPGNYVLKVDIKTNKPIKITGDYEFIFKIGGEDVKSKLMVEGDYIVTPGNDWATLTLAIDGVLSNPTRNGGDFGIVLNYSDAGTDFAGLCFDNIRFDPK